MKNIPWLSVVNKGLSLLVYLFYIIGMGIYGGFSFGTFRMAVVYLVFLSFIWFGDFWGGLTGFFVRGSQVNTETPGWMVCMMGWFFMAGLPVLMIFINSD